MKKLAVILVAGLVMGSVNVCFAEECNCVESQGKKSVLLEKIEDSTHSMAESVGEKSSEMADKTGKAIKKGAKKTGEAMKRGAKKAGKATKKGAKKATHWSATKIRNGAEKVIIKTEEAPVTTEPIAE